MKIKRLLWRIRTQGKIYWLLFRDSRTPRISKIMVLLAIAYLLWPFDLIPDFIPLAGFLDELIIVPIIFIIATMFIPKDIVEENKRKVKGQKSKDEEIIEGEIIE